MKGFIPVIVESYAGYKSDEHPIRIKIDNEWIDIEEINDRWYQAESSRLWPMSNYFRVQLKEKNQLILKHDLEKDEWYLCQ